MLLHTGRKPFYSKKCHLKKIIHKILENIILEWKMRNWAVYIFKEKEYLSLFYDFKSLII